MKDWTKEYPPDEATYRKRIFRIAVAGITSFVLALTAVFMVVNFHHKVGDRLQVFFGLCIAIGAVTFFWSLLAVFALQLHRWIMTCERFIELRVRVKKEAP